jgi:hypothetical protein
MHTSKLLKASDFQYWRLAEDERISVDFEGFCPGYHELDRVGVISPCLEDGILYTGDALLALTTAFYDVLRSRTTDFFDYPQHFAFIGASEDSVYTRGERLPMDHIGTGWGNLDVWPNSKWIATPRSLTGMVKKAFDFQINRLFWPQDFKQGSDESPLPAYARKMLGTRLKVVYYYNTPTPNVEIRASQKVADLVQRSLAEFPNAESEIKGRADEHPTQSNFPSVARYQQVSVDDFLEDMAGCFDGN